MTTMLYCMSRRWYCEYRCEGAFHVWIYHDGNVRVRIGRESTGYLEDTDITFKYSSKEAARADIFPILEAIK